MFGGLLDGWRLPFAIIYLLASGGFVVWMWRRNVRNIQSRAEARRFDHEYSALAAEIDLPRSEALPTVIPAAYFDASDTTPEPTLVVEQANTYCPTCWLDWIAAPWRGYFEPAGAPQFCAQHAYNTLDRALNLQREQQMQQETGEKYL